MNNDQRAKRARLAKAMALTMAWERAWALLPADMRAAHSLSDLAESEPIAGALWQKAIGIARTRQPSEITKAVVVQALRLGEASAGKDTFAGL